MIDKDRLIAFSDAIIAIAATIMVLELVNPHVPTFRVWLSSGQYF